MSTETPSPHHETTNANAARNPHDAASTPAPKGDTPALPIAAILFAAAGILLGLKVSWLLSVLAGIAAIATGLISHKRACPHLALAKVGIALGALDVIGSLGLVIYVVVTMASIGIA